MKTLMMRAGILILFSIPTEALAIYLEHSHFIEIGFVFSVIITFLLSFACKRRNEILLWRVGSAINIIANIVVYLLLPTENLGYSVFLKNGLLLLVFVICWIIPQIFGWFWGQMYTDSIGSRNKNNEVL